MRVPISEVSEVKATPKLIRSNHWNMEMNRLIFYHANLNPLFIMAPVWWPKYFTVPGSVCETTGAQEKLFWLSNFAHRNWAAILNRRHLTYQENNIFDLSSTSEMVHLVIHCVFWHWGIPNHLSFNRDFNSWPISKFFKKTLKC